MIPVRTPVPRMVTAACLVLAGWPLPGADALLPLPTGGDAAGLTTQALTALQRGDADPLSLLPISAFTAPNAIISGLVSTVDETVIRERRVERASVTSGLEWLFFRSVGWPARRWRRGERTGPSAPDRSATRTRHRCGVR